MTAIRRPIPPPAEYLLGRPGLRNPPGTVLRRAGQLAAQAVFGTVDEIVASPRLLPVLLLELLWLLGHDPGGRTALCAVSARAIASGNPALDYIGTGGPTPLHAPARSRRANAGVQSRAVRGIGPNTPDS